MKIAIHKSDLSFSTRWIDYCNNNGIDYTIANAFSTNIIEELRNVDIFLWHWNHGEPASFLFARQLILSIEKMGVKVYPDVNTSWHYDDKVGQKYLLEAIEAPLVPSYVFYNKNFALEWIKTTRFPKVFKLRGGYGATNVTLVNTPKEAKKLVNKAFGKGFDQINLKALLKERLYKLKKEKSLKSFFGVLKGGARFVFKKDIDNILGKEFGYAYFQDFVPDNTYDTRLIVIGDKCFGFRRFNRKNDFRASGSGDVDYRKEFIDIESVKISFKVSSQLKAQSLAFDFIYDEKKINRIIEISYCFGIKFSNSCPGYWNKNLEWVEGNFNMQECILQEVIDSIKK